MESKIHGERIGIAQAAVLAAMLGILTLALVNLGTEMSAAFKTAVHDLGKLWMPGAEGIGPYSGKETISLVVWLGSWPLLHWLLRDRKWNHQVVMAVFLAGTALATTLLWPPIFHFLGHYLSPN